MKKIIEFLKNWFQKNGLIKFLVAFILLIICVVIVRKSNSPQVVNIFNWIGYISGGYLVLTVLIFTIVGIVNSIKDSKRLK